MCTLECCCIRILICSRMLLKRLVKMQTVRRITRLFMGQPFFTAYRMRVISYSFLLGITVISPSIATFLYSTRSVHWYYSLLLYKNILHILTHTSSICLHFKRSMSSLSDGFIEEYSIGWLTFPTSRSSFHHQSWLKGLSPFVGCLLSAGGWASKL